MRVKGRVEAQRDGILLVRAFAVLVLMLGLFLAVTVLLEHGVGAAPAAGVINVDRFDGSCVTTSGDPYSAVYCEIQDAVFDSSAGDTIQISAGTYTETIDMSGQTLTLSGAGQGATILDGAGFSDSIIDILNSSHVTITGMTLQNGDADASSGGAVYNYNSTVTLINVTVFSNTSGLDAGGLSNWSGHMTLSNTTVMSNTAGSTGAGIANINEGVLVVINSSIVSNTSYSNGGGVNSNGALTVTNSLIAGNRTTGYGAAGAGIYNVEQMRLDNVTVRGNVATQGSGGGVASWMGSAVILGGTAIEDNRAGTGSYGGGIYHYGSSLVVRDATIANNRAGNGGGGIYVEQDAVVTVEQTTVYSNAVTGGNGGGVYFGDGVLEMRNSTIEGNLADEDGAGLYNWNNGFSTVVNTTIYDNESWSDGGAVFNSGALTLTNCTLSGNDAYGYGGGLHNSGAVTVTNCTIVNNTADANTSSSGDGGGFVSASPSAVARFRNTILANNDDTGGQYPDCYVVNGTISSNGYNLVETLGSTGFYCSSFDGEITGQDPLLGPLQDNDGETWTHALLEGSPALDSGDDGVCPLRDQRGMRRIPTCDVGAYELSMPAYLPLVLRN